MNKVNYYLKSLQILNILEKSGDKKPKLLLHACCGICMIYPLDFLYPYFDITIYYSNSNIYPIEEFEKRFETLKQYLSLYDEHFNHEIKVVKGSYDHTNFLADLKDFALEPEGGKRCEICYEKRIREAFIYAKDHNFDYVCTTLTSGRQKPSQKINEVAEKVSKEFPDIKYFYSDFKKKAGGEIGTARAKSLNLYLQHYCGCEFSKKNDDYMG